MPTPFYSHEEVKLPGQKTLERFKGFVLCGIKWKSTILITEDEANSKEKIEKYASFIAVDPSTVYTIGANDYGEKTCMIKMNMYTNSDDQKYTITKRSNMN